MSWILMTVFGFAMMFAMRYTADWLDFILVRLAGFAFIGAGLIGAEGWVGDIINGTIGWLFRTLNSLTDSAFGTSVAWILAAAITFLWIGGMLPGKVFDYDPPDWLVICGLIVPALGAMIPGKAGNAANMLITMGGEQVNGWVGGLFS